MYYTHFGLTQPPFKITPNTAFFFEGGNRGAILNALIFALAQGDGVIKVTGEVGSGKTMLCRILATRLPENIESIYLANPSVLPEDILHALAFELQLPIPPTASRLEVTHALHGFLLDRHHQGKQVILLVEEAQGMPLATLEEIRLLSNLETEHSKLLQIVLFGQPELNDNLNQPNMRQLKERITHNFSLGPLTTPEIKDYLSFRLRAAGYHGPDLFSHAVLGYMAKHSHGLTRRINIIADKILLSAFSEGTHNITIKHAKAAVQDSEFSNHWMPLWRKYTIPIASFLAILGLGMALPALYQRIDLHRTNAPATAVLSAPAKTASENALTPVAPAAPLPPASPAPAKAPTPNNATPPAQDLLESRITATDKWLAQESPDTISIQLTGSNDPKQLRSYILSIGKNVEMDAVFVYHTLAKSKPSMTILYGSFPNRLAATQALAALPASIKNSHPLLRTVKGIRAERQQMPTL